MNIKFLKKKISRAYKAFISNESVSLEKFMPVIKINSIEIDASVVSGNEWDKFRAKISTEFNENPSGFLRQPTISKTIHPNEQYIASKYLEELKSNEYVKSNIFPYIYDLPIGNPFYCEIFPSISTMTVQHIYYIELINEYLGVDLFDSEIKNVVEFGGGYGNLCRICSMLGYQGNYHIIDFPEMHQIQEFYTEFYNKNTKNHSINSFEDIGCLNGASIFVATFSLNETTIDFRLSIEKFLYEFDYIFIAYNRNFFGVDNNSYFFDLGNKMKEKYNVFKIKDKHRNAWFFICSRK